MGASNNHFGPNVEDAAEYAPGSTWDCFGCLAILATMTLMPGANGCVRSVALALSLSAAGSGNGGWPQLGMAGTMQRTRGGTSSPAILNNASLGDSVIGR
jgi:hypothetical protein